jgi:hypothetical protein
MFDTGGQIDMSPHELRAIKMAREPIDASRQMVGPESWTIFTRGFIIGYAPVWDEVKWPPGMVG